MAFVRADWLRDWPPPPTARRSGCPRNLSAGALPKRLQREGARELTAPTLARQHARRCHTLAHSFHGGGGGGGASLPPRSDRTCTCRSTQTANERTHKHTLTRAARDQQHKRISPTKLLRESSRMPSEQQKNCATTTPLARSLTHLYFTTTTTTISYYFLSSFWVSLQYDDCNRAAAAIVTHTSNTQSTTTTAPEI